MEKLGALWCFSSGGVVITIFRFYMSIPMFIMPPDKLTKFRYIKSDTPTVVEKFK
jgi:hypothetical protein